MLGRQPRELQSFRSLTPTDVIRLRLKIDRGQLLAYTVQLETYVDERWWPVARYDSAHGQHHRDLLDWDGRVIDKFWLDPTMDNKEAVRRAQQELEENGAAYVAAFLERKP